MRKAPKPPGWTWTEDTALALNGAPAKLIKAIKEGLEMRKQIKDYEREIEVLKESANAKLVEAFKTLGITKAGAAGYGTARLKQGKSVYYDRSDISQFLLANDVSAQVVGDAIEAGKKVKEYETVEHKLDV